MHRVLAGHSEGDLILGLGGTRSAPFVERTTRVTMLLHLPPGGRSRHHRAGAQGAAAGRARRRGGPRRDRHDGHDAAAALRKTLTWDQGAEMAQHRGKSAGQAAKKPILIGFLRAYVPSYCLAKPSR